MSQVRTITITHADSGWHEAFLRFAPKIFPHITFRPWYEHGGWTDRYTVFAMVEGDDIIASASLSKMELVLRGKRMQGWQLGAVGTLAEHRGRGLQQQILPRLLEQTDEGDLVFLFANHLVLDFYPRFGFERVREHLFRVEHKVAPRGNPLRTLDLASAEDRALVQRVAKQAQPATTLFGACDYGTNVLWYWSNLYRKGLRYSPELDAIFAIDQSGELLRIYDVLATTTVDLVSQLPRLISEPVTELELGFTPTRYFPEANPRVDHTDSPLFVRGPHHMPSEPFKFPMLAQT